MSNIVDLIKSRVSANSYDSTRELSEAGIVELIELATRAPSAFNAQNWKFIAVRSEQAKARLLPLAYNQPKITEAAVTFIVCGSLEPQQTLPAALKPTLDAGIISEEVFNGWIGAAQGMYQDQPGFQRDEAIRSGSLAAMTLMLAAQDKGLVSCPMIGFDPVAVARAFQLGEQDIPVMLITVGYPGSSNWVQKPRKAVSDVLTLV
jgi:nitroreductase